MKHLIALFVFVSLMIVGCTDNSQGPTSPLSGDTPARLAKSVPFKMKLSGLSAPNPTGRCAPSGLLTIEATGGGTATHLGRFTIVQSWCVNPATLEFTQGESTITAANGDILHINYSGHLVPVDPPIFAVVARFEHAGGSGRFANATGGGEASGTTNFVTGTYDLELDGSISLR